jgi:hypothetical protein
MKGAISVLVPLPCYHLQLLSGAGTSAMQDSRSVHAAGHHAGQQYCDRHIQVSVKDDWCYFGACSFALLTPAAVVRCWAPVLCRTAGPFMLQDIMLSNSTVKTLVGECQ